MAAPLTRKELPFLFLFGLLPLATFLLWIFLQSSLPWLPIELGWPWISVAEWDAPYLLAWNSLLWIIAGTLQTRWFGGTLPRPFDLRAGIFYLLPILLIFAFWQNTGILLWLFTWPQLSGVLLLNVLSLGILGGLIFIELRMVKPTLKERRKTRLLWILFLVTTPFMSGDRFLLALLWSLDLLRCEVQKKAEPFSFFDPLLALPRGIFRRNSSQR